jgi:hypothetical protein
MRCCVLDRGSCLLGAIQRASKGARAKWSALFDPAFLISRPFPAPVAVQLLPILLPAADFYAIPVSAAKRGFLFQKAPVGGAKYG